MLLSFSALPHLTRFRQVLRKLLANDSDPTFYEDLSDPIRSGMGALGYSLTNPLGIALDLRDHKVSAGVGVLQQVYTSVGVFIASRPSQAAHNESFSGRRILSPPIYVTIQNTRRRNTLPDRMSFPPSAPRKIACHEKIYFADAQVPGVDGGEDGVIIRCELDGTGVEIAVNSNLSDPRVRLDCLLLFILVFSRRFFMQNARHGVVLEQEGRCKGYFDAGLLSRTCLNQTTTGMFFFLYNCRTLTKIICCGVSLLG